MDYPSPPKTPTYRPSGFFQLRTPLLPFETFTSWAAGLAVHDAVDEPGRLEQALARDRALLRARLQSIIERPEVRQALYLASPGLEEALAYWYRDPDSRRGQRVQRALTRYLARMAGRPTPFGVCAGVSTGTVGRQTRLCISGSGAYRRHTCLDAETVAALDDAFRQLASGDGSGDSEPRYVANSSIYRVAGRVRYVEGCSDWPRCSHMLVSVEETGALAMTLECARDGATAAALAAELADAGIPPDAARKYISTLVDNQILVPVTGPAVTGPDPLEQLLNDRALETASQSEPRAIYEVRAALELLNAPGPGPSPAQYHRIAQAVAGLRGGDPAAVGFGAILVKPAPGATLGEKVCQELLHGVEILRRMTPHPGPDELDRFRARFTARYGTGEVPLQEALDDAVGVGFRRPPAEGTTGTPLLCGLPFPPPPADPEVWGVRERLLLRRLCLALEEGETEVVLREADWDSIARCAGTRPHGGPPLPDAFAVAATVAARSEAALRRGDFRVLLRGTAGPSGVSLLGRFCHADPALRHEVETHLREEEALQPEAVFAEVVHAPAGRAAEIVSRPLLRQHEIPYLGRSGAPAERQVHVRELLVSVQGPRIVLRSPRLGREVIQRLTCAHDFSGPGLPLYRFLGALQQQHVSARLSWNWGPLRGLPFLPRVVSGRAVLSLARWRVPEEELQALGRHDGAALFQAAREWRARRGLPRLAALVEGDQQLPIDLENPLSLESFVHLVRRRPYADLVEFFPPPGELRARGPEGGFVHEVIVPFVRDVGSVSRGGRSQPRSILRSEPQALESRCNFGAPRQEIHRRFPPGSEWLDARLYSAPVTADQVLREVVGPVVRDAGQSGAVESWFFVRYGEPDWHLRVRFHGNPARLRAEVMATLHAAATPLLDTGLLWRLQLDTYEREVERYGGAAGILQAERMFHADSEAVLAILESLAPGDAGLDKRWRLVLAAGDRLFTDFRLSHEERLNLLCRATATLAAEFRVDARLSRHVGLRFRGLRAELDSLLDLQCEDASPLAPGLAQLGHRSGRLAPILEEVRAAEQSGSLSVSLADLALCHLHMHANRLLCGSQRAQELVIYDFLARIYAGRAARSAAPAGYVRGISKQAIVLPAANDSG